MSWLKAVFLPTRTAQRANLCAEIELTRVHIERRDPANGAAETYLADASAAVDVGQVAAGWVALNAARRALFNEVDAATCDFSPPRGDESADDDETRRGTTATTLRAETSEKLMGWRLEAARAVLGDEDETPGWYELRHAQWLLDGHSNNVYRRIAIYQARIGFLVVLLAALVVGLIALAARGWEPLSETPLDDPGRVTVIALLGALGSILSVALSRASGSGRPVPEILESRLVDFLRPTLGAASAIVFIMLLESGFLPGTVETDGSKVFVWAIVAGFSERLLRRTLSTLGASARRQAERDE